LDGGMQNSETSTVCGQTPQSRGDNEGVNKSREGENLGKRDYKGESKHQKKPGEFSAM